MSASLPAGLARVPRDEGNGAGPRSIAPSSAPTEATPAGISRIGAARGLGEARDLESELLELARSVSRLALPELIDRACAVAAGALRCPVVLVEQVVDDGKGSVLRGSFGLHGPISVTELVARFSVRIRAVGEEWGSVTAWLVDGRGPNTAQWAFLERLAAIVGDAVDLDTDRRGALGAVDVALAALAEVEDGVVVQDGDGAVVHANPAACRLLGLSREQLTGAVRVPPGWQLLREDGTALATVDYPWLRALRSGRPRTGEVIGVLLPDPAPLIRWLQVSARPFRTLAGEARVASCFTDVTAACERVVALAESERTQRMALWSAPVGMAVIGLDGRWVQVNQALCELLDRDQSELVGHPVAAACAPVDRDRDRDCLAELLSGLRGRYEVQRRFERPDGELVWTRQSVSLVRDEHGDPLHLVAQIEDITQRRAAEETLEFQASHDPLTGLPNRGTLLERLDQELSRGRRRGSPVAVMFCDLDHFKEINDGLGHAAGDEVLVGMAARIRAAIRPSDLVGRLGGDEFVVVCSDADQRQLEQLANRVCAAASTPIVVAGRRIIPSASVGVALARPGCDAQSLLRDADMAMYVAKEAGRGRWFRHDSGLPDPPGHGYGYPHPAH